MVILSPPSISSPAVETGCWDLCCRGRASLPSGLYTGSFNQDTSDRHTLNLYIYCQQDTQRNKGLFLKLAERTIQDNKKGQRQIKSLKIPCMPCKCESLKSVPKIHSYNGIGAQYVVKTAQLCRGPSFKVCCELFWDNSTLYLKTGLCLF